MPERIEFSINPKGGVLESKRCADSRWSIIVESSKDPELNLECVGWAGLNQILRTIEKNDKKEQLLFFRDMSFQGDNGDDLLEFTRKLAKVKFEGIVFERCKISIFNFLRLLTPPFVESSSLVLRHCTIIPKNEPNQTLACFYERLFSEGRLPRVKKICLNNVAVNDEQLKIISHHLARNNSLHELDLSNVDGKGEGDNSFTDLGVKTHLINDCLLKNEALQSIKFPTTGTISKDTIDHLKQMLIMPPSMRLVVFKTTPMPSPFNLAKYFTPDRKKATYVMSNHQGNEEGYIVSSLFSHTIIVDDDINLQNSSLPHLLSLQCHRLIIRRKADGSNPKIDLSGIRPVENISMQKAGEEDLVGEDGFCGGSFRVIAAEIEAEPFARLLVQTRGSDGVKGHNGMHSPMGKNGEDGVDDRISGFIFHSLSKLNPAGHGLTCNEEDINYGSQGGQGGNGGKSVIISGSKDNPIECDVNPGQGGAHGHKGLLLSGHPGFPGLRYSSGWFSYSVNHQAIEKEYTQAKKLTKKNRADLYKKSESNSVNATKRASNGERGVVSNIQVDEVLPYFSLKNNEILIALRDQYQHYVSQKNQPTLPEEDKKLISKKHMFTFLEHMLKLAEYKHFEFAKHLIVTIQGLVEDGTSHPLEYFDPVEKEEIGQRVTDYLYRNFSTSINGMHDDGKDVREARKEKFDRVSSILKKCNESLVSLQSRIIEVRDEKIKSKLEKAVNSIQTIVGDLDKIKSTVESFSDKPSKPRTVFNSASADLGQHFNILCGILSPHDSVYSELNSYNIVAALRINLRNELGFSGWENLEQIVVDVIGLEDFQYGELLAGFFGAAPGIARVRKAQSARRALVVAAESAAEVELAPLLPQEVEALTVANGVLEVAEVAGEGELAPLLAAEEGAIAAGEVGVEVGLGSSAALAALPIFMGILIAESIYGNLKSSYDASEFRDHRKQFKDIRDKLDRLNREDFPKLFSLLNQASRELEKFIHDEMNNDRKKIPPRVRQIPPIDRPRTPEPRKRKPSEEDFVGLLVDYEEVEDDSGNVLLTFDGFIATEIRNVPEDLSVMISGISTKLCKLPVISLKLLLTQKELKTIQAKNSETTTTEGEYYQFPIDLMDIGAKHNELVEEGNATVTSYLHLPSFGFVETGSLKINLDPEIVKKCSSKINAGLDFLFSKSSMPLFTIEASSSDSDDQCDSETREDDPHSGRRLALKKAIKPVKKSHLKDKKCKKPTKKIESTTNELRLLNVGQGLSVVVTPKSHEELSVAVDFGSGQIDKLCGSEKEKKDYYETIAGVYSSCATFVLSHWHDDHYNLLLNPTLAKEVKPLGCNWIVPNNYHGTKADGLYKDLQTDNYVVSVACEDFDGDISIGKGDDFTEDVIGFDIPLPPGTKLYLSTVESKDVNSSATIIVTVPLGPGGKRKVLLPGDASYQYVPEAAKKDLSILVAAHHGSFHTIADGCKAGLYIPQAPSSGGIAFFSVGRNNKHGIAVDMKNNNKDKDVKYTGELYGKEGWNDRRETLTLDSHGFFRVNSTGGVKVSTFEEIPTL